MAQKLQGPYLPLFFAFHFLMEFQAPLQRHNCCIAWFVSFAQSYHIILYKLIKLQIITIIFFSFWFLNKLQIRNLFQNLIRNHSKKTFWQGNES